ncbi:HU family DNA-binding protein [Cetobacterium sp. 2A]|uniref:HU family DNA-binding protein n=1 Tax=Cetobacterium sp. 2A TaxID=2754723 RepID=UPI00163BF4F8|nr:HU family DNA-binding protein [Cetobacterium sp. 2A]MBC2855398.1 HU family DNA-binding protein [Cetobacterium sp. 2A]
MTKQEFINLHQENMGIDRKKEFEKLMSELFSTLEDILETGEELSIRGFGELEVVIQATRTYRNLKTEEVEKKGVKFKAEKGLVKKSVK